MFNSNLRVLVQPSGDQTDTYHLRLVRRIRGENGTIDLRCFVRCRVKRAQREGNERHRLGYLAIVAYSNCMLIDTSLDTMPHLFEVGEASVDVRFMGSIIQESAHQPGQDEQRRGGRRRGEAAANARDMFRLCSIVYQYGSVHKYHLSASTVVIHLAVI